MTCAERVCDVYSGGSWLSLETSLLTHGKREGSHTLKNVSNKETAC